MTAISFDTLKFANRLKQAGVPSAHAEADILEANLGELVTKADILDAKPSWIADEPNSLLYAKLVGLRMVVIGQLQTDGFSDECQLIDQQLPAVIPKMRYCL